MPTASSHAPKTVMRTASNLRVLAVLLRREEINHVAMPLNLPGGSHLVPRCVREQLE